VKCRIWGHDLDEEAAYYYAVYSCRRCGNVYDDDKGLREWIKLGWWLAARWIADRWWSWQLWWRCTECGGRFGRHDDSYDHIPF
jgi:rubredoxin